VKSMHPSTRSRLWLTACALSALMVPWSIVRAGKTIHENLTVDPQGSIEIINVAGSVDLSGWDRPEIEVTGTAGDDVDRIDVTTSGARSSVRVVSRPRSSWHEGNEARLTIHVPSKSAITATLVSADLKLKNLSADVKLQTVSGDVSGEVGGNLHATSVSGKVSLTTAAAKVIEVKTVSGDIHIAGGGGDVEITTISGDVKIELASLKRGRLKSVSGDLTAELTLAAAGELDGESVSGSLRINFAAVPSADFDVQSVSGDIASCFGPKPLESRYGPGSRLAFKSGDGAGHVHIETKSGEVHLCAKDLHADHAASIPTARNCEPRMTPVSGVGLKALGERVRHLPLL
jgi:DUF4097 and DUF4098 domain-containing protein YvlB